jgi:protein-S-isoprenylcysteine O-methyltransferase Ste14
MNRLAASLGSALFLVIAPGTIAGLIPYALSGWHVGPPFLGLVAVRVLGGVLIAAGLPVLLDSFARFAREGLGTPAPVAPPARLVVTGLYCHVRNPMYVALTALVLGQAGLLGSVPLLEYGGAVWVACHLFVRLVEEPGLRARFGADYERYCANVRRWIPRARPWSGGPA